jgi:predicted  nucleic acid-binding Zn-ribbon protein
MAHKAKKEWEQQQREMNRLKENNEDMQDALKRAKAAGEKVRDQISRLEGILSVRGGDQSVIKSALSDIKQNMG